MGEERYAKLKHSREVYASLNIILSHKVLEAMDLVHEIDSLQGSLMGMGMARDAEEVDAMADRLPKAIAEFDRMIRGLPRITPIFPTGGLRGRST
jgi:hypothetical protein